MFFAWKFFFGRSTRYWDLLFENNSRILSKMNIKARSRCSKRITAFFLAWLIAGSRSLVFPLEQPETASKRVLSTAFANTNPWSQDANGVSSSHCVRLSTANRYVRFLPSYLGHFYEPFFELRELTRGSLSLGTFLFHLFLRKISGNFKRTTFNEDLSEISHLASNSLLLQRLRVLCDYL